ncbi:hypothetical protein LguiA_000568 [Lonicera macranthoides]
MTHEGSNRNKRISTLNSDESERGRRKRSKKIRLICSDPYATDSSSDELQIGPKRIVREILLHHKNPIQIEQLLSASDKPKNQSFVSYELNNDSSTESPSSSGVKTENSTSPNDGSEIVNGGLTTGQFWNMSFGLDCGSVIIDNHGFLLGEFSRLDDLRIEKDNEGHLLR